VTHEPASSKRQCARLSEAEIAHYRREGWVIPEFRLAHDEVTPMRDALNELIRANPGVRPEKLVSAHIEGDNGEGVRGDARFLDLARDAELVEDLPFLDVASPGQRTCFAATSKSQFIGPGFFGKRLQGSTTIFPMTSRRSSARSASTARPSGYRAESDAPDWGRAPAPARCPAE
jgi:hypothetical protein